MGGGSIKLLFAGRPEGLCNFFGLTPSPFAHSSAGFILVKLPSGNFHLSPPHFGQEPSVPTKSLPSLVVPHPTHSSFTPLDLSEKAIILITSSVVHISCPPVQWFVESPLCLVRLARLVFAIAPVALHSLFRPALHSIEQDVSLYDFLPEARFH